MKTKTFLVIIFTILLLLSIITYTEAASVIDCTDSNVVSLLLFNETSGNLHDCGLENTWTATGTSLYDVDAYDNEKSILTQQTAFTSSSTYSGYMNADYSIIVILNVSSDGQSLSFNSVYANNADSNGDGIFMYYDGVNSKINVWCGGTQCGSIVGTINLKANSSYYMVTLTYNEDNNSAKLYINGTEDVYTDTWDTNTASNTMKISSLGYNPNFKGNHQFVEWAFFDKELTATEVQTYNDEFQQKLQPSQGFGNDYENNSNPFVGDDVNFSITVFGSENYQNYTFSYYDSGWINQSVVQLSQTGTINISTKETMPNASYFNYTWYLGGTDGSFTQSTLLFLNLQETNPPTLNNPQINSTLVFIYDTVNLSINITDETGVDYYIFSYYNVSSLQWINDSQVSANNATQLIGQAIKLMPNQSYYNYTWYAADINGFIGQSGIYDFALTEINPPTFSNDLTNGTTETWDTNVTFGITINDISGVDYYIFSYYDLNAENSTQRSSYYTNGTPNLYFADQIDDSLTPNGTVATNGLNTEDGGWTKWTNTGFTYTNAFKFSGSYSLDGSAATGAIQVGMRANIYNSTFTGKIRGMVYIPSTDIPNSNFIMNIDDDSGGVYKFLTIQSWNGAAGDLRYVDWQNGTPQPCLSGMTTASIADQWVEWFITYNDTTNEVKGYINGELCGNSTGFTGIETVNIGNADTNDVWVDELYISNNNDVPQGQAWINQSPINVPTNATIVSASTYEITNPFGTYFNYTWYAVDIYGTVGKSEDFYLLMVNQSLAFYEFPTMADNTANNTLTNLAINVSCNNLGVPQIRFTHNDTPLTQSTMVANGTEAGGHVVWNLNAGTIDYQDYYYYVGVCVTEGIGVNTSIRTWTYDTTEPTLTILQTLESINTIVNLSQYIEVNDNLSGVRDCEINFTYPQTGQYLNVNCTDTVDFPYAGIYIAELNSYDNANNLLTNNTNLSINPLNYAYFFDNRTGNPLNDSGITIDYPSGYSTTKYTNADGAINFSSVVNGVFELGDYDLTYPSTQGLISPITFTENINYSDVPVNLSYSIARANIFIQIFDRETDELILQNVSVQLVGLTTFYTTNGTIYYENLTIAAGTYQVITETDGYITEKQSFSYTNQEELELNIYMVNATSTDIGNLIVNVFDNFFNYVVGADAKLLEYKTDSSSFVQVSQCETNTNGECIFSVELGKKFYIVTATKTINGIPYFVQSTSNGELIKLDNTIIELHLETAQTFDVEELYNLIIIASNTTLVGNTSYLTATFSDVTNAQHTVCVGYWIDQSGQEIFLTENCLTGSTGVVNAAGGYNLDRTYTNIAKIYVKGTPDTIYDSYVYPALGTSFLETWGIYVGPFILFIALILLAASLYLKNIIIFAVGVIPLSLGTLYLTPTLLGGLTVTFIIVICITIIYLAKRKNEAY